MKMNMQGKLAALALILGAATLGNTKDGFAQSAADTLRVLQGTSYVMAQGVNYTLAGVDFDVPLGSDNLYMRGQNFDDPSQRLSLENAQEQMDAATNATYSGVKMSDNRNFWATTYYSSFVGDGTEGESRDWLVDITKYKMKRIGLMGGVTKDFTPNTKMGWFVGYSQGEMSQGVPFIDDNEIWEAEVKLADFQFGGTFQHVFSNLWTLNATVVGGGQNYSWLRCGTKTWDCYCSENCNDPSHDYKYSEYYKGATSGNTFSANVALSRKYDLQNNWYFTPCVAVESGSSWIYRGSEAGQMGGYSNIWQPYKLTEKIQFTRNTARVGATLGYAYDTFGFHGKAYYGTQLGGNDGAEISIAELNAKEGFDVSGSGFGRDTLQLGGGLWMALDEEKTTTLGGGYDAMLYKRATSQTMTATFTKRF